MNAIIQIQDKYVKVQDGDAIEIYSSSCDVCGTHYEITVTRDWKLVASFGNAAELRKREIYGGVVVDQNGTPLPEPEIVIHMIKHLSENKMSFIGKCGATIDKFQKGMFSDVVRFATEDEKKKFCKLCFAE